MSLDRAIPIKTRRGRVSLVGAGPGGVDLITVRGLDLLQRADVIVHDRLVDPELLREARPWALLVNVGKAPGDHALPQAAINDLLVRHAREGRLVVRLKGGDPFVFGRGWEELEHCRKAGIRCEVVPGVSSALAVPALAGIPVTLRGVSRTVAIVTGHTSDEKDAPRLNYPALAAIDTLVLLMARASLGEICRGLMEAGLSPQTPATCIASGATDRQREAVGDVGTIARIADDCGLAAPVVTVIGEVAGYASGRANHRQLLYSEGTGVGPVVTCALERYSQLNHTGP